MRLEIGRTSEKLASVFADVEVMAHPERISAKRWNKFPDHARCKHSQVTEARNVQAYIVPRNRTNAGHLGQAGEGDITKQYKLLRFCSNPCCELVFKAEV